MQYGFQKLVLLNSAGYSRAELPLDDSVSLVAPNNRGKTSLINALQFLLIIERRRMDFGAHDVDKSRRFYFPGNSSYILLEISLPESGTVVLGCVGKGVNFDYEYFAYEGALDIEQFCLPNGMLVAQPQLVSHLSRYGHKVFTYNSTDFTNMVYGSRSRKHSSQQNFCIFRLAHSSDASIFQRVLTRTLRLDKLRSAEVKDYLLQIFRRDLPDADIDFKAEWDKAFSELNADREQYQAAERLQHKLMDLDSKQKDRLVLRGKILCWRPLIEKALEQWQTYYEERRQFLNAQLEEYKKERDNLHHSDIQAAKERQQCESERVQHQSKCDKLNKLQQRFALIRERTVLENHCKEWRKKRDELVAQIHQVQNRRPEDIELELAEIESQLMVLEQEISTQGHNLFRQLADTIPPEKLHALKKILAKSVLTLGAENFQIDSQALLAALANTNTEQLCLPGLTVRLNGLPTQYEPRTLSELSQEIKRKQRQKTRLLEQLRVVRVFEEIRQECYELEQQQRQAEADLRDYDDMLQLQQSADERQSCLDELNEKIAALEDYLSQAEKRNSILDGRFQQQSRDLDALHRQHRQIDLLRHQRPDQESRFSWLSELPYRPWPTESDWNIEELADRLHVYINDCNNLNNLDNRINALLNEIHIEGLTKYQFLTEPESEINHLVEFFQHLPQEAEALEKKARSAVVNVSACLRELSDGLLFFKRRMREFNQKIGGHRLSDLTEFKIEAKEETTLVEAIKVLIDTASTVDKGESFTLFNQQSLLDSEQLNHAKALLIKEGNARNGLRVSDLFHLNFLIRKGEDKLETFEDIDSAASNGTVLMAKLVTGLAMLHLMQDQRCPIRGVCYLDEALALDVHNQRSLIDTATEFNFSLIFASPAPLTTARYCVPILQRDHKNYISRFSWQMIEHIGESS